MKYLKMLMIYLILILGFNLITTTLFYFNIISDKTLDILNTINFVIITFISSFYIGRRSNKKSIFEGLITGGIFILISLFIVLILPNKINILDFYNYIFILFITCLSCKTSNKFKIKNNK